MKIIIESGIEIPMRNSYRAALMEMKSGESFKFPFEHRARVNVSCYQIKKGGFKIRRISNTECRVWKV